MQELTPRQASVLSFIENFIFASGGTYYIAVSETSNIAYDPFDVTSGAPAVTTGGYTLGVTVAPGEGYGE